MVLVCECGLGLGLHVGLHMMHDLGSRLTINELTGSIPDSIGKLTGLTSLCVCSWHVPCMRCVVVTCMRYAGV